MKKGIHAEVCIYKGETPQPENLIRRIDVEMSALADYSKVCRSQSGRSTAIMFVDSIMLQPKSTYLVSVEFFPKVENMEISYSGSGAGGSQSAYMWSGDMHNNGVELQYSRIDQSGIFSHAYCVAKDLFVANL